MARGLKGLLRPMTIPRSGPISLQAEEVASSVPTEASSARAKPWFQRLVRLGLATRAVI